MDAEAGGDERDRTADPQPARPLWVSIARAVISRMPRGRYAVLSRWRPRRGRFVTQLGIEAGGAWFACDLGDAIAREACLTGLYEPPVTRIVQRWLPRGGTLVDAGANWGYFSLLGAAQVGPAGRVIALEPDPRQFARLRANVALNGLTNVTALAVAAGAREGIATLIGYAEGADNRGVSRVAEIGAAGAHYEVRCATIDALTASCRRVDVVKIDVEGAEPDVLNGMHTGMGERRYAAIVLELHPGLLRGGGIDPAACVEVLASHGYRGWTIDLSAHAYRMAADPRAGIERLLRPLGDWPTMTWPHLLWLAPGEPAPSC
jgi:FkbM family methyltransferase